MIIDVTFKCYLLYSIRNKNEGLQSKIIIGNPEEVTAEFNKDINNNYTYDGIVKLFGDGEQIRSNDKIVTCLDYKFKV